MDLVALIASANPVEGWDWKGILTHLSIGQAAALIMAAILMYGRYHHRKFAHLYHSKPNRFLHWFAHSYKAQFFVNFLLDLTIAIVTIEVFLL